MRIRRPRGITVPQLMVVTAVGFLGGVYIWKPLLIKYKNENPTEQSSKEGPTPTSSTQVTTTVEK